MTLYIDINGIISEINSNDILFIKSNRTEGKKTITFYLQNGKYGEFIFSNDEKLENALDGFNLLLDVHNKKSKFMCMLGMTLNTSYIYKHEYTDNDLCLNFRNLNDQHVISLKILKHKFISEDYEMLKERILTTK